MGLQFYVGEVQAQVNDAVRVSNEAKQAIAQLQSSISQFLSAPLSGKAYSSAKNYFSVAYTPLCRSAIITGEALVQAHRRLLSEYQSSVSSIDTIEDQVLAQIQQFEQLKQALERQIREAKTMRPDLERRYMNACDCIKQRREKLQKFHDYNNRSASFFNEYEACQQQYNSGVAQVQNSKAWNPANGTFNMSLLDMSWAKDINSKWDKRTENQEKQKNTKDKSLVDGIKSTMEDTVFPLAQDVAMELGDNWLEQNGDEMATNLYLAGTKYFGGTEIASGFYAGSKLVGNASKAMPFIGSAIDFGFQLTDGESVVDAGNKTIGHAVNGLIIATGVAAVGLTGGWALLATVGVGYLANNLFDTIYDNKDNIVKGVGNAVKSVGNWFGNAFS